MRIAGLSKKYSRTSRRKSGLEVGDRAYLSQSYEDEREKN